MRESKDLRPPVFRGRLGLGDMRKSYRGQKRRGRPPLPGKELASRNLKILHEDSDIIAVCKPDGILTQGDATGDKALFRTVRDYLTADPEEPPYLGLVHRLDRPVWGVVVFAKTSAAAAALSKQFREGTAHKTYYAVVEGIPEPMEGERVNHLLRIEGKNTRVFDAPRKDTQPASLVYRVIGATPSRSLLEVEPRTGRKHQIRVQLAHFGHPIVGDKRYGARDLIGDGRLALMARALSFEHPRSGRMTIEAPRPPWWPWKG